MVNIAASFTCELLLCKPSKKRHEYLASWGARLLLGQVEIYEVLDVLSGEFH